MESELFRIIVKIEHTTDVIALTLDRVDLQAYLVVELVEYLRHHEAQHERHEHEQHARRVRHEEEHARREEDGEPLHKRCERHEEPVDAALRFRHGKHEIVVVCRVVVARKINLRRLLVHLVLERGVELRPALKAPAVDKVPVRDDLDHVYDQHDADEQKRLPERLPVLRALEDVPDAEYVLDEHDHLVPEPVVQVVDHVTGARLKTQLPKEEMIL